VRSHLPQVLPDAAGVPVQHSVTLCVGLRFSGAWTLEVAIMGAGEEAAVKRLTCGEERSEEVVPWLEISGGTDWGTGDPFFDLSALVNLPDVPPCLALRFHLRPPKGTSGESPRGNDTRVKQQPQDTPRPPPTRSCQGNVDPRRCDEEACCERDCVVVEVADPDSSSTLMRSSCHLRKDRSVFLCELYRMLPDAEDWTLQAGAHDATTDTGATPLHFHDHTSHRSRGLRVSHPGSSHMVINPLAVGLPFGYPNSPFGRSSDNSGLLTGRTEPAGKWDAWSGLGMAEGDTGSEPYGTAEGDMDEAPRFDIE